MDFSVFDLNIPISITFIESYYSYDEKNRKNSFYRLKLIYGATGDRILSKTFNEFLNLHEKVKKSIDELCGFKFPTKRLFSSDNDPDIVAQRVLAIKEFINRLSKNQNNLKNNDIIRFFNLDEIKQLNTKNLIQTYVTGRLDSCSSNKSNSSDSYNKNSPSFSSDNMYLGEKNNPRASSNDFEYIKIIGKGSFGKVFLARHKLEHKFYAIKVLSKDLIISRNETKHIMSERNVLVKNVIHPFLVGLNYSFQTKDKLFCYGLC